MCCHCLNQKNKNSPVVLRNFSEIFGAEIPIIMYSISNMHKERVTPNFVGIRSKQLLAQTYTEGILLNTILNVRFLFL